MMKRTKLIFRELRNYRFLLKTISKQKRDVTSGWSKSNLRTDWFGRMYTVVSLREEDMGEEEVVRNFKAMQLMKPINEYLASLDLTEIIFPSIEVIPNSQSYLIVYSPLFKETTLLWLFSRSLLFLGLISFAFYHMIHG